MKYEKVPSNHNNKASNNKRPASKTILEEWLGKASNAAQSEIPAKCPICFKILKDENDLVKVNEHVDECLTKLAVKEILMNENGSGNENGNR